MKTNDFLLDKDGGFNMKNRKNRAFCLIALLLTFVMLFCGCQKPVEEPVDRGMDPSQSDSAAAPASPIDENTGKSSDTPSDISSGTSDASSDSSEPSSVRSATVLAVGDNLIHRGIYRNAAFYAKLAGNGAAYDFKPIYDGIAADIAAADISIINQETVFDPESEPSNYPQMNTPPEIADDLGALGFDVVSMANNHMMDMGASGLRRAAQKLDTVEGVSRVGAYLDETDFHTIRVLERDGMRIAVIAFTYGTNMGTGDGSMIIPILNEKNVKDQIARAQDIAEFVMVIVHWGDENHYELSNSQKKYAKLMADEGADVIIGAHPHLIQPIEWITASDGRRVLCAYSLGNLVSMMAYEKNMLGGVLTFKIVSENGERPYVTDVLFNPTVFFYLYGPGSGKDWFDDRVYYLSDFTEELAAKHGVMHYTPSGGSYSGGEQNTLSVANMYALAKKQISSEFLPSYVNDHG